MPDHPGGLRPPPLLNRGGENNIAVVVFPSLREDGRVLAVVIFPSLREDGRVLAVVVFPSLRGEGCLRSG
jgi:hypothetical protein